MKYPTLLHDYFDESVSRFPHKEALIFEDQRYTYTDIYNQAIILADKLVDLGLNPQDRVLIYMENTPEVLISIYATLKSGGIFIIINSSVKAQKLSYIINDCKPAVIIASQEKADRIIQAVENTKLDCKIIWTRKKMKNVAIANAPNTLHWDQIFKPSPLKLGSYETHKRSGKRVLDVDLAGLIYTSGSTGDPKGVMESHSSIISAAKSIIHYLKNVPDDIILNTLPLSFDYGLYQAIMTFMFGGTLVLEKSFIFPTQTLNLIAKEKVTGFPVVPTIVAILHKTVNLRSFELSTLRYLTSTGANFPVEHIKKLRDQVPHIHVFSMFGLTECKRISYLPPEMIDQKPDSVGKAMPNCEVFIVDENENLVEPGETGELVVRGSNVMQGYWNAPEQTARKFRRALGFQEKLLFTGDYFKRDSEGFLYFLGRKDGMIKSRGECISPKEIERVLGQIGGII